MKTFKDIQTQGDFNPFFLGASANWPAQKEEYKLPTPSLQRFHLKREGASEPRKTINQLVVCIPFDCSSCFRRGTNGLTSKTPNNNVPHRLRCARRFYRRKIFKSIELQYIVQTCSASANKSAMSNIVHVLFSLLLGSTKLFGLVLHVPHYVLEAL